MFIATTAKFRPAGRPVLTVFQESSYFKRSFACKNPRGGFFIASNKNFRNLPGGFFIATPFRNFWSGPFLGPFLARAKNSYFLTFRFHNVIVNNGIKRKFKATMVYGPFAGGVGYTNLESKKGPKRVWKGSIPDLEHRTFFGLAETPIRFDPVT